MICKIKKDCRVKILNKFALLRHVGNWCKINGVPPPPLLTPVLQILKPPNLRNYKSFNFCFYRLYYIHHTGFIDLKIESIQKFRSDKNTFIFQNVTSLFCTLNLEQSMLLFIPWHLYLINIVEDIVVLIGLKVDTFSELVFFNY